MDIQEWKRSIYDQLNERDKIQRDSYIGIARDYEQLMQKILEFRKSPNKINDNIISSQTSINANDSKLIELKATIEACNKDIRLKEIEFAKLETRNSIQKEEIETLKSDKSDLQGQNESLRAVKQNLEDEIQTMQLYCLKLEQKFAALQLENADLIARYLAIKDEHIDAMNKLNEKVAKKSEAKPVEKQASESNLPAQLPSFFCSVAAIPKNIFRTFDLTDDLYCMEYSKSGAQLAASNGSHIYLLNTTKSLSLASKLTGARNTINSIEYSQNDHLLLAASSDRSCHLWNLESNQLVDSFTGHNDKVSVAKFGYVDSSIIYSGGRDRILRLWDVKSNICTTSISANSSCIDMAIMDNYSGVSAHLDKSVRLYDFRSNKAEIAMKFTELVTSLVITKYKNQIVICCRDNNIHIVDIRFKEKPILLSDPNFVVTCDWSKISVSPDDTYVAAGGRSGEIKVWDIKKGVVEENLKGGHNFPIVACVWNRSGNELCSCDIRKHLVLWS